jgi:hypothetical protein
MFISLLMKRLHVIVVNADASAIHCTVNGFA